MFQRIRWFVYGTILAAGVSAVAVRQVHSHCSARTAFMATVVETFYKYPTAEVIREVTSSYAVSSTGLTITQRSFSAPDGRAVTHAVVVDPVSRKRVFIDGLTDSTVTTTLSKRIADSMREGTRSCSEAPHAEQSTLLNYDVIKVSKDLLPRAGKIYRRVESWVAPALDCYTLKQVLWYRVEPGPWTVANIRQVTRVELGEPNAGLGVIPPGYVERAPSEVQAEHRRRYNKDITPSVDLLDKSYYAQQ